MAFRAEVILAVAEGLSNKAVAERLGSRPATVSKWRGRFAQAGFSGLLDASRSGKPRQYEGAHERRILAALDEPPRGGGTGAGTAACWPTIWATSQNIRSGGFCPGMRSRWRGGAAGVSATRSQCGWCRGAAFLGRTASERQRAIFAAKGRPYPPDRLIQPPDVVGLVRFLSRARPR